MTVALLKKTGKTGRVDGRSKVLPRVTPGKGVNVKQGTQNLGGVLQKPKLVGHHAKKRRRVSGLGITHLLSGGNCVSGSSKRAPALSNGESTRDGERVTGWGGGDRKPSCDVVEELALQKNKEKRKKAARQKSMWGDPPPGTWPGTEKKTSAAALLVHAIESRKKRRGKVHRKGKEICYSSLLKPAGNLRSPPNVCYRREATKGPSCTLPGPSKGMD